jgi:conjugative relaxase-like TrwC/TraI family protein
VSLLWGLGDREVAGQVVAAHDAAVDAAVGYLERAAGYTRRGAGGVESVKVGGFVAAAFRHRTSRANDPLLHTHVLVANLAETVDDGVWRTLDSRRLYLHARTAGFLYQAQLRFELTRRLGVAWAPVTNGYADLEDVPRSWIDAFSQRRAAIVAELERRGEDSAAAAQAATLATRQAKDTRASEAELRDVWHGRARGFGVHDGWWRRLLDRTTPQRPDVGGLYETLVEDEGLTDKTSTFTRRDVLRTVAERLPTGGPVGYVEEIADAVIGHDPDRVIALGTRRGQLTALDVIRRGDGRIVPADAGEPRYTTRGLLLTEQAAVNRALARLDNRLATVPDTKVEAAIRRRTLTGEQATMVRRLTSSGAGVEVVVGKAGTGKTYALDAARDAWRSASIRVTGVALAARAALELRNTAGIPSTTLARLLGQLDDGRPSPLAPGSVLVVDEAGMVGTRQLARLLDHTRRLDVKVVLVGDPHQLPEIDAGGLFRTLTTRLPAVELTHNRRQQHRWEQAALDELRHGDPDMAVAAYRQHGRIVTADTAEAVREQLVTDWWDTYRQAGGSQTVMVALRRADVDDLNDRARTRLLQAGQLAGPTLEVGDIELQVGDRIVCLRNAARLGVVNGTRATITRIDPSRRAIHAEADDGTNVELPASYVEAGHVTHGYAITGHKAQGLTVDHTFVLGSAELYREWGYVALSRGRHTNRLYLCDSDHLDDLLHHKPAEPDVDQAARLTSRLRRSRAQQPVTPELVEVAAGWRQLHARLHAPDVARQRALTGRRARLAKDRQAVAEQLDRIGRRLEAAGAGLGRLRNRQLLAQLRADHHAYTGRLDRLDHQLHEVDAELAVLPSDRQIAELQDQHRLLASQLHWAASRRVAGYRDTWPDHLTTALGPPPADNRDRWEQAAFAIENYRLRWHITDPHRALGPEPADPLQHVEHLHATRTIEEARRELSREPAHHRSRTRGLTRGL